MSQLPPDNTPSSQTPPNLGSQNRSPQPSDLIWQQAAQELTPEKTLARITDNARNVVNTVGIVGVLLSGLGFLTTTVVGADPLLLTGAFASSILAATAVALALYSLITRNREVATGNLAEVEEWFRKEISRRRSAAFASVALFISALVALGVVGYGGYQAIDEARHPTVDNRTRVDVASNNDGTWTVHLTGKIEDLPYDATVYVQVKNGRKTVLATSANTDQDNIVTLDSETTVTGFPELSGTISVSDPDGKSSHLNLIPPGP